MSTRTPHLDALHHHATSSRSIDLHGAPVDVVMPSPQYDPVVGVHTPEHAAVDSPLALPYVPLGHGLQLPTEPFVLYWPAGHGDPVDVVAPTLHTDPGPALQRPEQLEVVRPVLLLKTPCGHREHMP